MSAESKTENEEQKTLLARVDPSLHKRVRVQAAMEDKSISEYMRDLADEHTPDV